MAKPDGICVVKFLDGPRAGMEFRCASPPSRYLRFADPVWCTYELNPDKITYSHLGNFRIVKDSLFGEARLVAVE